MPRETTGGEESHGSHGRPGANNKETARTIRNEAGDHGRAEQRVRAVENVLLGLKKHIEDP